MKNKFFSLTAAALAFSASANAAEIATNTAKLQAMDKITGKVNVIEAPVNQEIRFGSFSIVVRACKTRPPEETPDNYAFVDVIDIGLDNLQKNIFKGWMISSSPALNAIEHPIYDVWLLQCVNTTVDKSKLLNAEQLRERDEIPQQAKEETVSADQNEPENLLQISEEEEEMPVATSVPEAGSARIDEPAAQSQPQEKEISADDNAPEALINISEEALIEQKPDEEVAGSDVIPENDENDENDEAAAASTKEETLSPEPTVVDDGEQPLLKEENVSASDSEEANDAHFIEFDIEEVEENALPALKADALTGQ